MILLSAGHSISPRGFWYSWVEEPLVTIVVFALTAMYLVGWFRLKEQAPRYTRDSWRLWCYLGGVFSLTVALLSPIAAYSEELFAMHMVQHLLLLIVAPPLILLGAPLVPLLWTMPESLRLIVARQLRPGQPLLTIGHWFTTPIIAIAVYVGSVAIWHIPPFYDAAQGRTFTHDLEHVMFYGAALLCWWPSIRRAGDDACHWDGPFPISSHHSWREC